MRIRQSMRRTHRRGHADGSNWLSFSDLMSSLLLIFILIMFYIMYQYFDMYEINMAEIARQQYDLDQANADLDEKTAKLSEAESQLLAQQLRLNSAQKELEDAESVLARQQEDLAAAESLLEEKEQQIAAQESELDTLGIQLDKQQATLNAQQTRLNEQQGKLTEQQEKLAQQQATMDTQRQTLAQQQATMDAQRATLTQQQETMDAQQQRLAQQQVTMDAQQMKLDAQQVTLESQRETLEQQQIQIEQLVGLKTRIISSLSDALRAANISAQVDPTNGSIALESDVLFATNKFDLTDRGKAFIDEFLPVYLEVLLSEEYGRYVTEIIIEGHTDTAGDYISNLQLSQRRALAVASYVLADNYRGITSRQKEQLRKLATANGRSWSDPVLDSRGRVNMDASRRVVFKFRMTDEQMIQQLKTILEEE